MLDVASPMAASSQDVSRSGDHTDTATTTPESTASTNVGEPVNQTPSSSAISAPSNIYQLNPVSDSVPDGTSGDLSSTTSSLNAAQSDQLNPFATSTSSRLSQAVDGAQITSSNSGAMTQSGAFIGSDPQLAQTPNPASAFVLSGNSVLSGSGVLSGNGALFGNGDLATSIQGVSTKVNAMMNTLGSNMNIPQNGAVSIGSADILSGNAHLAPSTQDVSSQANTLVNTVGPILNIPQTGGLDPILRAGMLSGNGGLATSIQGVSTKANAMVNTLGSNLDVPQNDAVSIVSADILSGIGHLAPSTQDVSSQANTLVNTVGPILNIPQTGGLDPILRAGMLSGNGDLGVSTKANAMVNTLGSNLDIPQNDAVSIVSADILSGTGHLAPSTQDVSSQANTLVNTVGPILNIPQTGGLDPILRGDMSSGNGGLATSIQGASTTANAIVNTLESNLDIPQNDPVPIVSADILSGIGHLAPSTNVPLPSGLDAIGSNIVGISTIPMSSLISPVQAASNTISDPSRQLSFTNNFFPDSLNTPLISGVETSPSLSDHTEANTATTTTGNCICNS